LRLEAWRQVEIEDKDKVEAKVEVEDKDKVEAEM